MFILWLIEDNYPMIQDPFPTRELATDERLRLIERYGWDPDDIEVKIAIDPAVLQEVIDILKTMQPYDIPDRVSAKDVLANLERIIGDV